MTAAKYGKINQIPAGLRAEDIMAADGRREIMSGEENE
jgi:hypothetical protein